MKANPTDYFVGRVVTVLTQPVAREFPATEQGSYQHSQYFTGRVEHVDSTGLWLLDPGRKVRSYFQWQWIVGVCEEQEVGEDHPVVKKAVELQKQKRQPADPGLPVGGMSVSDLNAALNSLGGAK